MLAIERETGRKNVTSKSSRWAYDSLSLGQEEILETIPHAKDQK